MSFFSVRQVKASRKQRVCDECRNPIGVGEAYAAVACKFEGEFWTSEAHDECRRWANKVICCDDGRGFLIDHHPADEDQDELFAAIRANRPSPDLDERLPFVWREVVREALAGAEPVSELLL